MFNQTLLGQFFLKRVGKHHNLKYSWTCYRAAQCGRRWWWVGFHYCWQGILIPSSGCYEVAVAYWSSNSQNGSTICNMKYLLKLFNKYFVLQINDCMMETSCWQLLTTFISYAAKIFCLLRNINCNGLPPTGGQVVSVVSFFYKRSE